MDSKGKYHMNPHHAKMADAAPKKQGAEGSPKEEATEPKAEAMAEGDPMQDQGSGMEVTCPGCGERFPLEAGLAPEQGQGAVPTHESQGAAMPVLGGY
jgi:hypothetical protein